MQWTHSANLCMNLRSTILTQHVGSFITSKELLAKGCYSPRMGHCTWLHIAMQTGHDALLQGTQLLDIVYFLVGPLYHGKARNKSLFQGRPPKLNTDPWQPPPVNLLSCDTFYRIYKKAIDNLPPYFVTTKLHSILQPIQFTMNKPSTSNWIATPFVRKFKMANSRQLMCKHNSK